MRATVLAYAAGLIDGEGSITLGRTAGHFGFPVVSMTSTTRALIDFMLDQFGGFVCEHTKKTVNHSRAWSWRLNGRKALEFMTSIYPYCFEPEKLRRMYMFINKYPKVTLRNGKYTAKQRAAKFAFEKEFLWNSRRAS